MNAEVEPRLKLRVWMRSLKWLLMIIPATGEEFLAEPLNLSLKELIEDDSQATRGLWMVKGKGKGVVPL